MKQQIEKIVYNMLTENTGKHFLDSGGSSSRHWQCNQLKTIEDFINDDDQVFEVDIERNEIIRTVSVFHYLAGMGSCLELDDICNEFNEIQDKSTDDKWSDFDIHGVFQGGANYLESFEDFQIEFDWNTYNYDSDLSQVLQGSNITINDNEYVIIQIHGGCDVRGGYTNAKLFRLAHMPGGCINEALLEYMDSDYIEEELEYIDKMTDYWDNTKIYKGKQLETIKKAILEA